MKFLKRWWKALLLKQQTKKNWVKYARTTFVSSGQLSRWLDLDICAQDLVEFYMDGRKTVGVVIAMGQFGRSAYGGMVQVNWYQTVWLSRREMVLVGRPLVYAALELVREGVSVTMVDLPQSFGLWSFQPDPPGEPGITRYFSFTLNERGEYTFIQTGEGRQWLKVKGK